MSLYFRVHFSMQTLNCGSSQFGTLLFLDLESDIHTQSPTMTTGTWKHIVYIMCIPQPMTYCLHCESVTGWVGESLNYWGIGTSSASTPTNIKMLNMISSIISLGRSCLYCSLSLISLFKCDWLLLKLYSYNEYNASSSFWDSDNCIITINLL